MLGREGEGFIDATWLWGSVDESRGGSRERFLREFVSRMRDGFVQEWNGKVERSDRFAVYRLLRQSFGRPNTTRMMTNPGRDALVRLKFGVSGLKSHVCRYGDWEGGDLLCPLCASATEDEFHFLFDCLFYKDKDNFIHPTWGNLIGMALTVT